MTTEEALAIGGLPGFTLGKETLEFTVGDVDVGYFPHEGQWRIRLDMGAAPVDEVVGLALLYARLDDLCVSKGLMLCPYWEPTAGRVWGVYNEVAPGRAIGRWLTFGFPTWLRAVLCPDIIHKLQD